MSKRVINSIVNNIARLREQIAKLEVKYVAAQAKVHRNHNEKVMPLLQKIEKFEAMLEMLHAYAAKDLPPQPASDIAQATSPEPSKAEVPAFLGKNHRHSEKESA